MKIYSEKEKVKKSWSLQFEQMENDVYVNAVDSITGEIIAHLMSFYEGGKISFTRSAKGNLERHGYDPHEHGNNFDGDGRLVIG